MRPLIRDIGLSFISGVLLILSFPKFDLHPLAWVGLVPLLVILDRKRLREAYLLSYLTGLLFFSGIFYWIWAVRPFNLLDYTLLAIYLPQYVGLWGLGLNWIRQRTGLPASLIAPPLWVTIEYARSHFFFLGVPWALLGHSQYMYPSIIQIASITGVYGLSFLIVFVNAAIAEGLSHVQVKFSERTHPLPFARNLASLVGALFLLTATYLYGQHLLSTPNTGEHRRIALVQGNIPQEQKWDKSYRQLILDKHVALTQNGAAHRGPLLIVWPETAVPGDVQHEPALRQKLGQVAVSAGSYLLVGSAEYAKFTDRRLVGKYFNSMYLFSPDGTTLDEYRKIKLVPFGEYEPLKGFIKWPQAIASPVTNTLAGDKYTIFNINGASFGVTICWENIFPELFREFVKRGASFMVNGTNEARFGDTAEAYQHLAINVFRAAENRIAIARSANTGISAFIDPFGRITDRLKNLNQKELFVEGVLVADIVLSEKRTFYTKYGDIFAHSQIALSALFLSLLLLKPVRRK